MSTGRAAPTRVCDKPVGPIGYGLLSLTMPAPFPQTEREVAVQCLRSALEQGANLWNGGIHYGTPEANSLHLLKYYFEKYPEDVEKVVLSIKGAYGSKTGPTGSPEAIRASVEEALQGLGGMKTIDVFEMARVDPNTPIETSVKALAELVEEGKIGGVGLSEVSASTIRKAHAIHPIAAVEVELSLFTPDPLHNGIMDTCHELGIPVVGYSPVGRGWLTGQYKKVDDLPPNDFRHMFPRFKPEVFDQNYKLVEAVTKVAERKDLKTSQVAVAWAARQGAIPIPGSSNVDRVVLNSKLSELTEEDMRELQKALDLFPIAGERYGGAHEKLLNA
ncbi:Aldo/keto reductase [Dothidotthia symphoricarpi CBS 119687]|uniref:Aldo/keto reductase n=1 Tax=Dothidotthia symphoricarpi CBS 119687 TaxID=1392245 RepID=A0A6A6A6A5_9PLEO|nr:Aldo/keto reductase [Dothidotthia symphoricarpi CBS 119687]KAF2126683.1 Aldo/keto reductase [Dothidotthia symphoricarpi CBS 119687]